MHVFALDRLLHGVSRGEVTLTSRIGHGVLSGCPHLAMVSGDWYIPNGISARLYVLVTHARNRCTLGIVLDLMSLFPNHLRRTSIILVAKYI